MKYIIPVLFSLFIFFNCSGQTPVTPVIKSAIKENRSKEYNYLIKSIKTNLMLPLTDSTEENWQDAFNAMELINYRSPFTDAKIRLAFNAIDKRSTDFQRAALELIYTLQIKGYTSAVHKLLLQTGNSKVFAMCAEYLLLNNKSNALQDKLTDLIGRKIDSIEERKDLAIYRSLLNRLMAKLSYKTISNINVQDLFSAGYLKGNVIVYSIQRKNRNYPGITIVKDKNGNFITDDSGTVFSVPQLARSITNLPGYLTNGNTPQGIFRMDGFEVSKGSFIGPTENIQLTMPVETPDQHFFKDSSISDIVGTKELYAKLLPETLKNYEPLYESFYAGMAGRTEIIAHGTTVNPEYYKTQPYFPHTPTLGCLCTKEIWSAVDGKRIESDQQKLVDAVKKAGGADGYCIVIEIDDQQKPVSIKDILPFLK